MKNNALHFCGIDVLRCLAMLMVVILHVLGHGKILKTSAGISSIPYELLESLCYGAVDIFAMALRLSPGFFKMETIQIF